MSSHNSLIVNVDVNLDRPAKVYVEYENARAGRFRSKVAEHADRTHRISLVRLRPSTTYSFEVFVVDEAGDGLSLWQGDFRTGPLPPGLRRAFAIANGQPTYPLTLKEHNDDDFFGMLVLDSEANVVWYYESTDDGVGAIAQKPNGNMVYISGGIREITPLGEEVARLGLPCLGPPSDARFHHEVYPRPDGKVIYLSSAIHQPRLSGRLERPQTSDTIWEWDQTSGETRLLFDLYDFIPVTERTSDSDISSESGAAGLFFWKGCYGGVEGVQDWTHSNSLFVGRRGNVIMSIRHLDQIISIAPDYRSIEWRLGGPGGDFTFPNPADRFYHQHSAKELANGNILLFDNGNGRPEEEGGEYSRALELKIDLRRMTAVSAWEYRHTPDLLSTCCSNVTRLPSGNTAVLFTGDFGEDRCCRNHTVVEVDSSANKLWEMQMRSPGQETQYRIYPIFSIDGEVEVPHADQ